MRTYTVYKYTNTTNDKVYIGTTSLPLHHRCGKNGNSYKACPAFWAAIQTDGWSSFECEILEQGLTKEDAALMERHYIATYNSTNPSAGYNIQKGGFNQYGADNTFFGRTHSVEARKIIAESNKRRVWTDASKAKTREKLSGENSPFAKKVVCVETGIVYSCIKKAAADSGAPYSKISEVLHGHRKTAGGFHWKFAES